MESKQIVAALLGCLCIASAGAASTADASLTQTVEELIRLDAQDAIKASRQKTTPALPSTETLPVVKQTQSVSKPSADKDVITVSAIYGYGDRLRAVVSVNGQMQAALKEGEQFAGYEIDKISGRCVTFKPLQPAVQHAESSQQKVNAKNKKGIQRTGKGQTDTTAVNAPVTRCYAAKPPAPAPLPYAAGVNSMNSFNGFNPENGARPPSLPMLQTLLPPVAASPTASK